MCHYSDYSWFQLTGILKKNATLVFKRGLFLFYNTLEICCMACFGTGNKRICDLNRCLTIQVSVAYATNRAGLCD